MRLPLTLHGAIFQAEERLLGSGSFGKRRKTASPMITSLRFGALVCIPFFASIISVFAQGNLIPPGAPAPTMKSLDQIASTGIAINAANTPGDSNYDCIISTAGS